MSKGVWFVPTFLFEKLATMDLCRRVYSYISERESKNTEAGFFHIMLKLNEIKFFYKSVKFNKYFHGYL